MADHDLQRLEAALGAVAKITSEGDPELIGARCPRCEASDFVNIPDLFSDAVGRLEANPDAGSAVHVGGLTDMQIVGKFPPPRRRSPAGVVVALAIPLGAASFFVYRRFGDTLGQATILATAIILVIVLLTSMRRLSDRYYRERRRWRTLFMCRKCGQLVSA